MTEQGNPPVDPLLQIFVQAMAQAGGQAGLTILVGGAWVSGTLIPPRMFMEETGAYLVDQAGEDAAGLRTFFHELGRMHFPSESEAAAGAAPEPEATPVPYHLHLRHARSIYPTGEPIPADGCYLRVRLSEIAGWVVGALGPPGYTPPPPPRPPG